MEAVWEKVKSAIKDRVPAHTFNMWIAPLEYGGFDQQTFILYSPNFFSRNRVKTHYADLLRDQLAVALGKQVILVIEAGRRSTGGSRELAPSRQRSLPNMGIRPHSGRLLRRDFTFDQFVVGGNNDFAYTASLAMASRKKHKNGCENALFLLSRPGMGKSHLSQAIGHYIISEHPAESVYYMTAEDFSAEMVGAFREDTVDRFKEKYRQNCDVLLLEDIHYLSGKDRTQIELAMTLDFLLESDKKIIFSSCYRLADIPKLNDKLRSRLSYGLTSTIEPPDFKTRVRILKKKASAYGSQVPAEVIGYLASELTEDVRQLESGLVGVSAKSSLMGIPIDQDLAESVVQHIIRQRKRVTIEVIKKLVCRQYKITVADIVSRSRRQAVVRPRQIAMYLSRKYTDSPLQVIGKSFNRYHATAMHAIATIEKGLRRNGAVKKQVEYLQKKLETGDF